MEYELKYPIKYIKTLVKHFTGFNDSFERIVIWHSGIYKSTIKNKQPRILVAFRRLHGVALSSEIEYDRIPSSNLRFFFIGSIWKNHYCIGYVEYELREFNVNFHKKGWRFTSAYFASKFGKQPFPSHMHPLNPNYKDESWLIQFNIDNGELVIPCLEFYFSTYGSSAEIQRILMTYGWVDAKHRLYNVVSEAAQKGKPWEVAPQRRLAKNDTAILAHIINTPNVESIVRSVNAQIESQYSPGSKKPIFVKIAPWFESSGRIKVLGIPFDDNRSFLGLSIVGYDYPPTNDIDRLIDKSYSKNKNDGDLDDDTGVPALLTKKIFPENEINLTSEENPEFGSSKMEIYTRAIEIMNDEIKIQDKVERFQSSGLTLIGEEFAKLSSEESCGFNTQTSRAEIVAPFVAEHQGVHLEMWKELHELSKDKPNGCDVRRIMSYTFKGGYSSSEKPSMIELTPFPDEVKYIDGKAKKWVYLRKSAPTECRSVLVARFEYNGTPFFLFEIERDFSTITLSDGRLIHDEEDLRGLIMPSMSDVCDKGTIQRVINLIRIHSGRMHKVADEIKFAYHFNHKPSMMNHERPYTNVVMNAVSKATKAVVK